MVKGPYPEFVRLVSYRVAERGNLRSAAFEINRRTMESTSLRKALAKAHALLAEKDSTIEIQMDQITEYHDWNLKLQGDVARLRPWATVGKIGVILTGVVVVGVVAERIIVASP